jgi:hypothetical protein
VAAGVEGIVDNLAIFHVFLIITVFTTFLRLSSGTHGRGEARQFGRIRVCPS